MMVIWIVGMSGSGKSYLAKRLKKKITILSNKIKWIDGDKFREKYSKDLGYSLKDRKINSRRIQKHCLKYFKKGYIVICSILSIFPSHQKKNAKIFKNKYFQIYIKASVGKLKKRNNKKIYSKKKQVVGKNIIFPKPYKSDLVIKNNFNKTFLKNLRPIVNKIYEKI